MPGSIYIDPSDNGAGPEKWHYRLLLVERRPRGDYRRVLRRARVKFTDNEGSLGMPEIETSNPLSNKVRKRIRERTGFVAYEIGEHPISEIGANRIAEALYEYETRE
ncbi:MAG: hypothetical protein JSV63_02830 [Candidatus Aenigmatarchaeota archaeon]|nr:MAG: hypothetical protein JSV63_02830 [Candidatus Aenigmarchaeota archaeon]